MRRDITCTLKRKQISLLPQSILHFQPSFVEPRVKRHEITIGRGNLSDFVAHSSQVQAATVYKTLDLALRECIYTVQSSGHSSNENFSVE